MEESLGLHVVVFVLGDVGRSPRMQYHALSLSKMASVQQVSVIGYLEEKGLSSIESSSKIRQYGLSSFPFLLCLPRSLYLLYALLKVAFQVLAVLYVFFFRLRSRPQVIFVQNPPSIPTLALVKLIAWLFRALFVVDWHNLGYTVLGYSIGETHPLVKISYQFEHFFGSKGDYHLAVTDKLREYLIQNASIPHDRIITFYDRPLAELCYPRPLQEQHRLFIELQRTDSRLRPEWQTVVDQQKKVETYFTEEDRATGQVKYRDNRPIVLVSSTSWTKDEDFGILLRALMVFERKVQKKTIVFVTGKGPMKAYYMDKIDSLELEYVSIICLWLKMEDYPVILSAADLGICLHMSTSGLDLPMKVLDMFGCGLPVCAASFKALPELVHHTKNGMVFHDSDELADQLCNLFVDYPKSSILVKMKQNVGFKETWQTEWDAKIKPVLTKLCTS